MPMPELDPSRFFAAVLADPTHKLPLPDRGGRLFLAEGEVIDSDAPFYAHLLADGSLKRKPDEGAKPEKPADLPPATKITKPAVDGTADTATKADTKA